VACADRALKPKQFRRAFPVHPIPAASEGEWQTRNLKREAAIAMVRKSPEFKKCVAAGRQLPAGPDPSDRSISKRQWEMQVMKFRDAVKAMSSTLMAPALCSQTTSKAARRRWADMVDDDDELA